MDHHKRTQGGQGYYRDIRPHQGRAEQYLGFLEKTHHQLCTLLSAAGKMVHFQLVGVHQRDLRAGEKAL